MSSLGLVFQDHFKNKYNLSTIQRWAYSIVFFSQRSQRRKDF